MAVSLLELVSRVLHVESQAVVVLGLVLPVLDEELECYALALIDSYWSDRHLLLEGFVRDELFFGIFDIQADAGVCADG